MFRHPMPRGSIHKVDVQPFVFFFSPHAVRAWSLHRSHSGALCCFCSVTIQTTISMYELFDLNYNKSPHFYIVFKGKNYRSISQSKWYLKNSSASVLREDCSHHDSTFGWPLGRFNNFSLPFCPTCSYPNPTKFSSQSAMWSRIQRSLLLPRRWRNAPVGLSASRTFSQSPGIQALVCNFLTFSFSGKTDSTQLDFTQKKQIKKTYLLVNFFLVFRKSSLQHHLISMSWTLLWSSRRGSWASPTHWPQRLHARANWSQVS